MSSNGEACIICNVAWVPDTDYIEIFGADSNRESDLHVASLVFKLLDKEIKEEPNGPQLICKKCFSLISELDELHTRVTEIKSEIFDSNKIKEENDSQETQSECGTENFPQKMLFIPSSDEDSTQVSTEKNCFENIQLEFVKMHGIDLETGIEQPRENTDMEIDTNIEYQQFSADEGEILDAGAMENSSDSDYEPSNISSSLIQSSLMGVDKEITLKLEDSDVTMKTSGNSDKKPIILRKKMSTMPLEIKLEEKKSETTIALPVVSKDGDLYTCLLCQGDQTVAGESKAIVIHVKEAHGVRLYICDVCGQDFSKRNELSAHFDEHVASEEGDFQCEICNRIFSNLRLFRIHKRMHYPQTKAWVCETCGKKYSSKNLLEEHVNTHLGVRPYICEVCGKDFASKYTYKAHEKTHEFRPRPYKCSQCDKSFLSQQNLTQHERTHLGMKEYACQLCGKQFGSSHNLEVHSIVHTGYKPFVCGLCGKAFARKAEIRDHERTHTGERPYQCEFCGATFSQRSNLQSHKRATHYDDKRYQCTICSKGFKRRRLLDYHIKAAHTGERPFKCEICEATFVYPEHFKKHRRIHTGEKPFLCEVCGKAFNSRDNRNAHRFIHSDKKPYECLVCGAGFMRKPLLYQHMQNQGHLNDTIVVNQPRLTTEDDQLVTVNSAGEMEILDTATDGKLYIQDQDGTEHIIIDGQQISFAEVGSEGDNEEAIEQIEHVIADQTDDDCEEIISSDALASGETQIIETPDGPIQLVKVRIPNENGEEEEAWIKIVPE
ncbi:zinc finger protein 260-like [Diorhabda carinulata]|uniref:zinc finger protein 260-like n=1 Tax=Diorhabda carinulata TaxID=1163345 RepID=UPI0024E1356D|nr:zinc finger protein 260-like isoform X1 [Diorhabda sublineata]XP_056642522.1 zinc finger protein 260-like isoform X1 [Diorhabda sublineata]XP_057662626.1 zinc finger protein 260-like [Diorhabda carinulata]XP_057662627.1 zinc finger protein 260-like [Diorhabda carinulata]